MKCEECDRDATYGYQGRRLCWVHFEKSLVAERMGHAESTPPETPYAKRQNRPESLLPPRAMPGAGASAVFIAFASAIATDSSLPVAKRAIAVALASLIAWLIGYFTQPPRRRFRRGD